MKNNRITTKENAVKKAIPAYAIKIMLHLREKYGENGDRVMSTGSNELAIFSDDTLSILQHMEKEVGDALNKLLPSNWVGAFRCSYDGHWHASIIRV